jgi:hypothetical protein
MAKVEREVEFPAQGEISALVGDKIKTIMEESPHKIAITAISGDLSGIEGEFFVGSQIGRDVKAILAEYHSDVPDSLGDFGLHSYNLEGDEGGTAIISVEESDD